MQMLLSANDLEAVLGSNILNGIEQIECRIRTLCLDYIANGGNLTGIARFSVLRPTNQSRLCYSMRTVTMLTLTDVAVTCLLHL